MKFFAFITVLTLTLSAMAADPNKIIGDDDLVAVDAEATNIPLRYKELVDAFGLLSMGCTATHIGNGIVLTAGHCFWAEETPIRDRDCSDTQISWGVRDGKEAYMTSKCEKIIIAQREGMNDYAVLRVSPVPPVAIMPDMQRRAEVGDAVTIFSHPQRQTLRWSNVCTIEEAQHPELPVGSMQHKCDTNPGSSGATIIDVIELKVVGIHDGGLGGNSWSDPDDPNSPTSTGMNYGTYIQNSPLGDTLRSLGFN